MLQEVTTAALSNEPKQRDPTPTLPTHLRGQQQLDANTKALTEMRLAFAMGTWASVVDPLQMAELAKFGNGFPSMWCGACPQQRPATPL